MGRLIGIARREQKRADMEILENAEISEQTGVAKDFRGKPGIFEDFPDRRRPTSGRATRSWASSLARASACRQVMSFSATGILSGREPSA